MGFAIAPRGILLSTVAIAALLASPARSAEEAAGAVEVTVRERDGGPIRDLPVTLERQADDGSSRSRWLPSAGTAPTGADGRVEFASVAPGSYLVRPAVTGNALAQRGLVPPADNPFAPMPRITVARGDRVRVALELWRGAPVVGQVVTDDAEMPPAAVLFRSRESAVELRSPVGPNGYAERLLPPGRWEIDLDPPKGRLLTDFEVDGEARPGHAAILDFDASSSPRFLTWRFRRPCRVTGHIVTADGSLPCVRVVARSTAPGAWAAAARERGGSIVDEVGARFLPDHPDRFVIDLPDGAWRIAPEGPSLSSADPESADVVLAPGDTRSVEFLVRCKDSGPVLPVSVRSRSFEPIAGASVWVWRRTDDPHTAEPIAKVRTSAQGRAEVKGLGEGDYRIAAGHGDFVEGSVEVLGFDPAKPKPCSLVLDPGASLRARALDEKNSAAEDVEVTYERIDGPPELTVREPELLAAKTRAGMVTDATGRAKSGGLYPGRYALTARVRGEHAMTRFARVSRDGGRPEERVEVTLDGGGSVEIAVAVLPAASIRVTLACADGGALPAAASVRVFEASTPSKSRVDDPNLRVGARLALDDLALGGPYHDALVAGPIEAGPIQLAVRPSGFSRWSWFVGSDERERATTIDAKIGETASPGRVDVVCAPVAELRPKVATVLALPDLREADIAARAVPRSGPDAGRAFEPRVELRRDAVLLFGLPEGDVDVEVRASHEHFLPGPLDWSFRATFERGKTVDRDPKVPGIGGSVRVRATGAAVRFEAKGANARIEPLRNGLAIVGSLPAGTYRVGVCADLSCSSVADWGDVAVHAATTRELCEVCPAASAP